MSALATTFRIHKLADTSRGERVTRFHPVTGEKLLVNPATNKPEPWPLLGVLLEGEIPQPCRLSTKIVDQGIREGWIRGEERRVETAPAGPANDPLRKRHNFARFDALRFICLDGEFLFEITHQPGKYRDGEQVRVDHFYELRFLSKET